MHPDPIGMVYVEGKSGGFIEDLNRIKEAMKRFLRAKLDRLWPQKQRLHLEML
jgi:hypothetical protein